MNSNDIRTQIQKAIKHEQQTHNTAQLFEKNSNNLGLGLSAIQQEEILNFVKSYVIETPDIMDAAFHAAQQANMLAMLQPILDAAFNYWQQELDFIPDNLGLIGLADDAYLTRVFMHSVSVLYTAQTGQSLLSIDLAPANLAMRNILGDPVVTQLEVHVGQTIASQLMQTNINQLMNFAGPLSMNMPGYGDYMNQYDLDHEVDVRLGAMGVI